MAIPKFLIGGMNAGGRGIGGIVVVWYWWLWLHICGGDGDGCCNSSSFK